MKSVALKHKEIITKISQFNNGQAAETMQKMGLVYSINHGLSMPQIDSIANAIKKDNELACFLWQQQERESKLLALRIAEASELKPQQITLFINGLVNVELAEQAAIRLFVLLNAPLELACQLIKKDEFIQLAGYILIAQTAITDKETPHSVYADLLDELMMNLPCNNNAYLKRGLARAFLRIGMRSKELKTKIETSIKIMAVNHPKLSVYLNQEVNYFLL